MHQRKIPMRMCTGCNEMKPKRELVRIVKEGPAVGAGLLLQNTR